MAPRKKDGAAASSTKPKTHNLIDPAIRKEFIERRDHWQHLDGKYKEIANKAKAAAKARKQYEQEIERAGFTMAQISVSLAVLTPEGEAEFKARIAQEMLAAAYAGAEVGDQLSLFFDPDRTPAIERAAHEGQLAAMEHKAHAPPYDPSVPQYRAWSDAFYAEQERQVLAGISKKETAEKPKGAKGKRGPKKGPNADPPSGSERSLIKKAEKEAKEAAKAPKADAQPPRTKPSVAPVTRASQRAEREAARQEAESYFTKATEPAGSA